MSSRDGEKYYWLKLKRDFFKRHDICLLEAQPNGRDALLLYLKLMVESIDHGGRLRYSEEKPYTEAMLGVVLHTDAETMTACLQTLREYEFVVLLEDGTFFLPAVPKLTGSETYQAKRKREARETRYSMPEEVIFTPEIEKEIEIEKETETEKESESETDTDSAEIQRISAPAAIPLVDKTLFVASEEEIQEWQKAYPAVDVAQQLREMRMWSLANPKLCKTRKGVKRFIVSWLSREQDKGHPGMAVKREKTRREFVPTEL